MSNQESSIASDESIISSVNIPTHLASYTNVSTDLEKYILKSQTKTTYDIACVVYELYKEQFRCTSIIFNRWVELCDNKWKHTNEDVNLFNKLSREVIMEYLKRVEYYNCVINQTPNTHAIRTAQLLMEVTYLLRDFNFKSKIMKECQYLFYDSSILD